MSAYFAAYAKAPTKEHRSHVKMIRFFGLPLSLSIFLLLGYADALAAEVWLSGVDPIVRQVLDPGSVSDYMDLFQRRAAWSQAAMRTHVFKTSTQFLARASDKQLALMFADLKQRHIALAVEGLMLTGRNGCGNGVESYAAVNEMASVAARVLRLGGDLQFVAMDEPLWFGHIYSGLAACHSSVTALAQDVATKVAAIRRVFPNVQVGDIEPIANRQQPADWIDQIVDWAEAYRLAVGTPLSFVDADVQWSGLWRPQLEALSSRLRASGIKYGIIYNGDSNDQTGLDWTRHAEERVVAVEANPKLIPDRAILQTWMRQPLHILPETQGGTMTWLVNRYAAAETLITMRQQDGQLIGRLMTADGQPVRGVALEVAAIDLYALAPPTVREVVGTVPQDAVKAAFALRINAECDCSGPAHVTLGALYYQDDRTEQEVERRFSLSTNNKRRSAADVSFSATPDTKIHRTTEAFSVLAGDSFTARIALQASLDSSNSGYVALIFLDRQLREIERVRLPLIPSLTTLGWTTTDEAGRFTFRLDSFLPRLNSGFRLTFAGNDRYRLSSATFP